MWIVSDDDKTVASTWGATIHLKAGEPREVGHDLGLLCLQAGCIEVKGDKKVEEVQVEEAPVVEDEPVVEVHEEVDLESMTKVELEAHGRTMGIELDRRKKKSDLIAELQAAE
tara:strand:- start:1 stop:339 length:339 start_codon:yes stop_codon:yes gene_type:complete